MPENFYICPLSADNTANCNLCAESGNPDPNMQQLFCDPSDSLFDINAANFGTISQELLDDIAASGDGPQ